jgi:acetyl esterase/lipase
LRWHLRLNVWFEAHGGQSDSVDPQGQAYEMYRALRQVGVPVELVIYPREQHLTLMSGVYGQPSGEPWHGFDSLTPERER